MRVGVQQQNASLRLVNGSTLPLTRTSGLPLYNTTGYTISAWFFIDRHASGYNCTIYGEGNSGTLTQFMLIDVTTSVGLVRFKVVNDAGTVLRDVTGNLRVPMGVWNHVLLSDKAGVVNVYLNNVLDTSGVYSYTPSGAFTFDQSTIGQLRRTVYANQLTGKMSSVQLFNYALTPTQATAVYQGQLTGNVGSYSLGEGAGTTAYDTSGNGNNGTITSGTWSPDTPFKTRKLVNDNLVYNGDFEYAPVVNVAQTSGSTWIDGSSAGQTTGSTSIFGFSTSTITGSWAVLFDKTTANSGSTSLKISTTGTASYISVFSSRTRSPAATPIGFDVLPNTSYICSVAIKTNLVSGSATTGARVRFLERNGFLVTVVTNATPSITTTTNWTTYSQTFTTGSATRYILPILEIVGNDGTGTLIMDAWFDDIQLRQTTLPTRSPAVGRTSSSGRSGA